MTNFQTIPLVLPSGLIVDSGMPPKEYDRRIAELIELHDCDHSDAEGIFTCQFLEGLK